MIDKKYITNILDKVYKSRYILDEELYRDCAMMVNEKWGVSNDVVNETKRLTNVILQNLKNANHKILGNGVGQYKVIFYDKLFGEDFKFSVSNINFSYESVWRKERDRFIKELGASIDISHNLVKINIESIEGIIQPQTFQGSLQHEIHHFYETEKSKSTWASVDEYKMAIELMNKRFSEGNKKVNECLYMIGVLFYMYFKGEREGYANGLDAFLRNRGQKVTKKNIHTLSRQDESHFIIYVLKTLSDILSEIKIVPEFDEALDYVNKTYSKQYSRDKLNNICRETFNDFVRRTNRVKYKAINDINETELYPLSSIRKYMPILN